MANFTPVSALIGGAFIGLSAVLLMLLNGRIAGISGILGNLLRPQQGEWQWRLAFVAGLAVAPLLLSSASQVSAAVDIAAGWPALVVGGLLVGFGTRMGGGCTSGHGVCGLARFSPRSLVATLVFMAAGAAVVFVIRHILGT